MAGIPKRLIKAGEIEVSEWVERWPTVRLDQISEIENMEINTLNTLEFMVKGASKKYGWRYNINSSWRRGGKGQHPKGRAIDGYFFKKNPGDVNLIDQFFFASRFDWHGMGLYPFWNTPGLHCDTRPLRSNEYRSYWWFDKQKKQHSITEITDILKWEMVI